MNVKNNRQFQGSAIRMEQAMLELMNTMPDIWKESKRVTVHTSPE